MGPIFQLSLRQLASKWRIAIITLLVLLPIAVVAAGRALGDEFAGDGAVRAIIDSMIVAGVMPIVTMTLATATFGNEIEDRTLRYLVLNPIPRWSIVFPKMLAPAAIAGPVLAISGMAAVLIGFEADFRMVVAVGVGLLAGVLTYSVIFAWAGLMTSHALGFALVYVFVWEGLLSTFLGGIRYLSVRSYALTLMEKIGGSRLDTFAEFSIELPAAIVGAVGVSAVFFWLAVRRLRRMDVP